MPFYIVYQTENTQEIMGKILVGEGGGEGTRREALLEERRDREVPWVANLDRSPDQSPGGEAHISLSQGTNGHQEEALLAGVPIRWGWESTP